MLYQGRSVYNKGSKFWTTDKEWARQFTQSGRDQEIASMKYRDEMIYRANLLPMATNDEDFDRGLEEAKNKGYKAFWVDEGQGQPNSVYII